FAPGGWPVEPELMRRAPDTRHEDTPGKGERLPEHKRSECDPSSHARGSGFAGPMGGAPRGQERSDWGADHAASASVISSICASTAGVSFGTTSTAARLLCSWLSFDAPVITLLTRGLRATQAIASCATLQPSSAATP